MEHGTQSDIWVKVRVQAKRYFVVVRRLWWLLPLTISIGTAVAAWIVSRMPPAYISVSRMMVSGQIKGLNQGASYSEELSDFYGTQIQLMTSGELREHALQRVETLHPELAPEPVNYDVSKVPAASIFVLTVTAKTASFAQAYLEACMDEYIETKKRLRLEKSDDTTVAISQEMANLDRQIEANDAEMLDFQKNNNVGFLETEGNSAAKYLSTLNQTLQKLQSEYDLLQLLDLDQNLDRQQSQAADSASTDSDGKADATLANYGPIGDYQHARQVLAQFKAQLAEMSTRLKPKHPDIKALDDQIKKQETLIDVLRSQSVEALKTHREDLRLQIQNLDNEIKNQEAEALTYSSKLSEFDRLKTKADRKKLEYDRLLANLNSVDVTKNVDQDIISVLDHASPASSIKPEWEKILLDGVGAGLAVGLVIIFIIDQFDDRISSLMELQTHFPEHLLGQIPLDNFEKSGALLRPSDDRQGLLESFRTLRSSLIFLPVEGKRPKTFLVTSALPNEGKTTVTSNLAVTLAFSGAKTLVVDADLRSGKISKLFGVAGADGVSGILLQKLSWRDAVYSTPTTNLFVMPCGSPLHHTAEHLLGKVTDQLLLDIYDQFDFILFDSPPSLILDDTLCLAPKIDATLFVIRFASSSVRSSRRAMELLHQRQINVIGVVCNGVTLSETEYNYNYNYRQYASKYAEVKAGP